MEKRRKEFEQVKQIIKNNKDYFNGGLFFTRNIVGNFMENIFHGEFFSVYVCKGYEYFKVFGTNDEEEEILERVYND